MDPATELGIFEEIQRRFSLKHAAEPKIKQIISDYSDPSVELSIITMRKILPMLKEELQEEMNDWQELKLALKAIFILINMVKLPVLLCQKETDLVNIYPEFRGVDQDELNKLLYFRNIIAVSLHTTVGKNHKGELLEIAGRLCGDSCVTGGGQTKKTTRRVLLYERESGIPRRVKRKAMSSSSSVTPIGNFLDIGGCKPSKKPRKKISQPSTEGLVHTRSSSQLPSAELNRDDVHLPPGAGGPILLQDPDQQSLPLELGHFPAASSSRIVDARGLDGEDIELAGSDFAFMQMSTDFDVTSPIWISHNQSNSIMKSFAISEEEGGNLANALNAPESEKKHLFNMTSPSDLFEPKPYNDNRVLLPTGSATPFAN
jgi:hypothetical protein